MRYLLSNDDGYQAIGLILLAEALKELGEVTVIAPERDRSGASHSLTLNAPIHVHTADNGFIYISGTPTDCVHLFITGLLGEEPDMVLSGINAGANLGDDVLYSGTVAAATEARFLGCPAIAISLASKGNSNPVHFDSAVRVTLEIIKLLPNQSFGSELLLNVNVPDIPYEEIGAFEVTRLGKRCKPEPAIKCEDPKGQAVFQIGPVGSEQDAEPGTDFYAINNNNVSITPLQTDLTKYSIIDDVTQLLGERLSKKSEDMP